MLKFLLVVALFAGLVYAVMWAIERRRAARSGGPARRTPFGPAARDQQQRRRPVAPDDDEDFLRWLDRKRRNGTDS